MSLARQRHDWEDLGTHDPLWAILSDPARRGDRWTLEEFFAAGEVEVRSLIAWADRLRRPRARGRALDFGCGVGRNTRALASHFTTVVGLDVAQPMVHRASQLNSEIENCEFLVNDATDLAQFSNETFDLVYCNIVLQHMLSDALIEDYVREFVRVLAPDGLLVFQLPSVIPWRYQLQPRRHLYRALRLIGIRPAFLMNRLHLYPISMRAIPTSRVRTLLDEARATILDTTTGLIEPFGIETAMYAVTKA